MSPREHLEGLARYAALVAEQMSALEDHDTEAFLRLTEERERLQERLDALGTPGELDPERTREVAEALRAAQSTDARLQALIRRHQDGAREEIAALDDRGGQARRYLARSVPPGRSTGIDVTF